MAKIFGGNASRFELYALFVAAVVLIGGGISGAIVVTSGGEQSSTTTTTVQQIESSNTSATAVGEFEQDPQSPATTPQPIQQSIDSSTYPTITVPGLTADQTETLRQQIQRQQETDAAAAQAAAYAANHPVGTVRDVLYCTDSGEPAAHFRWSYLGKYPAPAGVILSFTFNGRTFTGSPNGYYGDYSRQSFSIAWPTAPPPGTALSYTITTNGPEGAISGSLMPTVVACSDFAD
jgi:hypothetical protein